MASDVKWEAQIIVQSLRETIAPKLIAPDVEIMKVIEQEAFPGVQYVPGNMSQLEEAIKKIAGEQNFVVTDTWMTKILQLYQIQNIHHGVMMVGGSGSGKSGAWKVLLQALQQVEGQEGVSHVIDPKVMSKEALYGSLDSTTREWTDGLFTSILRKIVDNLRGEDTKRHWIVFDGDVDPEWVENLNRYGFLFILFSFELRNAAANEMSKVCWMTTSFSLSPTENVLTFLPTSASCSRSKPLSTLLLLLYLVVVWSGSPRIPLLPT
jgi:dynein heavy chain 1